MKTKFFNSVVAAIIAIMLGMVFVACSGNDLEATPKGEGGEQGGDGHGDGHLDANVDTVYIVSSVVVENSRKVVDTEYGKKVTYDRQSIVCVKYNAEEDYFSFDTTVISQNILNIYIPEKRDVYRKDLVFETEGATETRWEEAGVKIVNNLFNFAGTKENIKLTSETQSFSFAGKQVTFPEITWGATEYLINSNTFVKDSVIGDRTFHYTDVALTFESVLSDNSVEQYDALLGVFTTDDGYVPGGDEDDPNVIFKGYQDLEYYIENENLFVKFTKVIIWNDGREDRTEIVRNLNATISGEAEKIVEQSSNAIVRFSTDESKNSSSIVDGFFSGNRVETTHIVSFDGGKWNSSVTTAIDILTYQDEDITVDLGKDLKWVVNYTTSNQAASYEVVKNGKTYNRFPTTLNFIGSVKDLTKNVANSVLVDVEKEEIVETFEYRAENLRHYQENGNWYAEFTLVTISSINGESRSQVKRNLNVSIVTQPELTKRQNDKAIVGAGETSSTTEKNFTDGDFSGKTMTTVYTFNYDGGNWNHNITAKYDDVVYTKDNLKVEMSKGLDWNVVYSDYAQSQATQVTVGGETYFRYPSVLNYIGTFNGYSETVKQNVNIDVLKPFEDNIPEELGEIISIDVTKVVSAIVNNVPSFRTCVGIKCENGVLLVMADEVSDNSFPTNKTYMYGVDINKPSGVVSAAVKTSDARGWVPANILINDGVDYRNGWTYKAYTDANYTQLIGQRVVNMMTGDKTPEILHSATKQADGSWIVSIAGSQVLRVK